MLGLGVGGLSGVGEWELGGEAGGLLGLLLFGEGVGLGCSGYLG